MATVPVDLADEVIYTTYHIFYAKEGRFAVVIAEFACPDFELDRSEAQRGQRRELFA